MPAQSVYGDVAREAEGSGQTRSGNTLSVVEAADGNEATILKILNCIYRTFVQLVNQVWLLPHTLASLSASRKQQVALDKLESERLDRIRNPNKYRGKEI
jgi:hypothetical protein